MDATCTHCGHVNQATEASVQCTKCKHYYFAPIHDEPETMLKCEQCGKRWPTLCNGRCLFCVSRKP